MKQQIEVTVRLHLEMDAEADISTEIIAGLQVFADSAIKPVEIIDIKEEADLYGNDGKQLRERGVV